jgi:transposase, IS30 family
MSKPSNYQHFTKEQRIELWSLHKQEFSLRYIAKELDKSTSSISRELQRNKDPTTGDYHYSLAHQQARNRRCKANKLRIKIQLGSNLEEYILKKLELNWSPEQIAGRLRLDQEKLKLPTPTCQTIYDHIYLHRKDYRHYLRCKKGKYRRKRGTRLREQEREELKKKRIDTRPEIINQRERLGDWEGDTIIGAEKTIHILTHVDRTSGYLLADKAEDISKEGIQKLTLNSFQKLPKSRVKSITYDNGVQFNKYEDTEEKLRKQTKNQEFGIYFAYAYHSWERGTNENTNGLLREYFPKKSEFKNITQAELDKKVKLINNRPRKRLNYLTPQEVFHGRKKPESLRSQSVALGNGM